MTPERNHKLIMSNLCDQLSTSVDGTGIMDRDCSSRSTCMTNRISAADEDDVAMGGHVDVP